MMTVFIVSAVAVVGVLGYILVLDSRIRNQDKVTDEK